MHVQSMTATSAMSAHRLTHTHTHTLIDMDRHLLRHRHTQTQTHTDIKQSVKQLLLPGVGPVHQHWAGAFGLVN